MSVEEIANQLLENPRFVHEIRLGVDDILKDGKIDAADIPTFVIVLTIALEHINDLQIKQENIPEVLVKVTQMICDKFHLIPEDKKDEFERGLRASLKLLFFHPRIRSVVTGCVSCFGKKPLVK
jgi:hypothetical protein